MGRRNIKPGRYGVAPAYEMLRDEGRTFEGVARASKRPYSHVRFALRGDCRPHPDLIAYLEKTLDRPAEQLFTEAALAKPFAHSMVRS
jgi:hypothetical protein